MIILKTPKQIERMRVAGRIAAETIREIQKHIRAGITTNALDEIAESYIRSKNAKPACKNYHGFPASICASPDEVVVHGIPNDIPLREGQILSIDLVVRFEGYDADMARTFPVGAISKEKQDLIRITEESFFEAMRFARAGESLRSICGAIQSHNEKHGYSLIRALTGHGIGKNMHEDPSIPNFLTKGIDIPLREGMTLAIEPMVSAGHYDVELDKDGWTLRTKDKSCAAHYENTIAITQDGYRILTEL